MKLDFVKLNPTQNMTVIVTSPVPRELQPYAAERLMAYESVNAEQVGFLEAAQHPEARARLQMMGGEFCGNAAMSTGAYLAFTDGLPDGIETRCCLEVSGAETPLELRILRCGSAYRGTVSMPLPTAIREVRFEEDRSYPTVFLPGIAHAIVPESELTRAQAEECIARWCAVSGEDAFGIILTDFKADRIAPLVYVKSTRSAVWERGCGSGSAALGAYLAFSGGRSVDLDIAQPGGIIRVAAAYGAGSVQQIEISGTVRIVATGQAFID